MCVLFINVWMNKSEIYYFDNYTVAVNVLD